MTYVFFSQQQVTTTWTIKGLERCIVVRYELYLKKFSRKKKLYFVGSLTILTHDITRFLFHHFMCTNEFFFLKKRPNCYTFFPLSKGYADNHFRLLLYCIFSNDVVYDLHVNFMHTWQKFPKITIRNDQKKRKYF